LSYTAYTFIDQVDHTKKWLCVSCANLTTVCYMCGVPVRKDYLTLADGRLICRRDRAGVVLDEATALEMCQDVDRTLQALLGRFTRFPETNVVIRLADRVDERTLVGVAGNDFTCPNLLGYTLSLQMPGGLLHQIRLLTGLQRGVLRATYAHELAHAWIAENVSKARQLSIHPDAVEGFCELLGYLVAESYGDESAMKLIVENQYSRGQVLVFIEAKRRFGVGDAFDWIQYGQGTRLPEDDLYAIRAVNMPAGAPSRPVSEFLFIPTAPAPPREALELTSVTIGPIGPTLSVATINGRAFGVKEERKVPLGGSNVVLRCLAIARDSVLVEHVESGRQEQLRLRHSANPKPE